jgi:hypothetical protein
VSPSKTPIIPVNPAFLPQSETECEICDRTVYVTHIDKKVLEKTIIIKASASLWSEHGWLAFLSLYTYSPLLDQATI